jgi:hypothetical protein
MPDQQAISILVILAAVPSELDSGAVPVVTMGHGHLRVRNLPCGSNGHRKGVLTEHGTKSSLWL